MRATRGTCATNLPPSGSGFVGRRGDLSRIHDRLGADDRLVTVVGPGGVGKTRLAIRYAHDHQSAFAQVWFVDLTEAADMDGICSAVSRALGIPLPGNANGSRHVETIGAQLASRGDALVIADNCEQVADAAAAAIAAWLRAAPALRVLATSRERLRVDAEVVVMLEPLPHDEAVALFIDRARRGDAIVPVDGDDAHAIGKIVEQLDALPLAIELAAARASVLSPTALLERLTQRFDVLSAGARDAEPRHRTLRATIDWSWQLLEPWERDALAQLSVFRGGFTLGAAEAVLDLSDHADAPTALDAVQALRDKSLVHAARGGRFGLYLSVRDYAAAELPARDPAGTARLRHADYFLRIGLEAARVAEQRGEAVANDILAADEDNLLAVADGAFDPTRTLQALLALEPLRTTLGPFAPYVDRLSRALTAATEASVASALLARAHTARGRLHGLAGRHRDAVTDLSRAAELAVDAGDGGIEGRALLRLGVMHATQGDYDVARAVYGSALDRLRAIGDRLSEGMARENLAIACAETGYFDEAREHFAAAREVYVDVGDDRRQARSLANVGTVLQDEGRLEEARQHYDEAMRVFHAIGDRRAYAVFLGHLGTLDHLEGDTARAGERYLEAAQVARDLGDRPFEAVHLGLRSTVAADDDDVERAAEMQRRAADLLAGANDAAATAALDIHRMHIGLARARRADAAGDDGTAARERDAVRAGIAELLDDVLFDRPGARLPHKARIAVRLLQRTLARDDRARARAQHAEPLPPDALVIGPDARWFCAPGGEPVDLTRRKSLRKLLRRLAEAHELEGGRGLSVDDLLAAGWPGERVSKEAGANRVRVALTTLRKLGLRDHVRSSSDGYVLTPGLAIRQDPRPVPPRGS